MYRALCKRCARDANKRTTRPWSRLIIDYRESAGPISEKKESKDVERSEKKKKRKDRRSKNTRTGQSVRTATAEPRCSTSEIHEYRRTSRPTGVVAWIGSGEECPSVIGSCPIQPRVHHHDRHEDLEEGSDPVPYASCGRCVELNPYGVWDESKHWPVDRLRTTRVYSCGLFPRGSSASWAGCWTDQRRRGFIYRSTLDTPTPRSTGVKQSGMNRRWSGDSGWVLRCGAVRCGAVPEGST